MSAEGATKAAVKLHLYGIQIGGILGVTGHRPGRLEGDPEQVERTLQRVAALAIGYAAPSKVITGMAQGWDMACASVCLSLKIPFVAAVPFSTQAAQWPEKARSRYHRLIDKAAEVVVVSPGGYEYWKMQARNKWIVDTCDSLLSLWDLVPGGGTASCVAYAAQLKRPTFNAFPLLKVSEKEEQTRCEERAADAAAFAAAMQLRGAA